VSVLTLPAEYFDSVQPARVAAVAGFGFTERQARFLVTVMVHSGVFLERQYCAFAGISHGQKSHDFAAKLTAHRFATAIAPGRLHQGACFTSTTSHSTRRLASPTTGTARRSRWVE
jgi:hypothetical protein